MTRVVHYILCGTLQDMPINNRNNEINRQNVGSRYVELWRMRWFKGNTLFEGVYIRVTWHCHNYDMTLSWTCHKRYEHVINFHNVIHCHSVVVMTSWNCLGCLECDKLTLIKVTLPEVVLVMTSWHKSKRHYQKLSLDLFWDVFIMTNWH